MQIRSDSYQIIYNQTLSKLDPRDFSTPVEYFQAVDALVWEWLVEQWNGQDRRYEQIRSSILHVFLSPPIDEDPMHTVLGAEITVKEDDLTRFCDAYKLDPVQMRLLSDGKIREYKKWRRSGKLSPQINGSPYVQPKAQMSEAEKRKRKQEVANEQTRMKNLAYRSPVQQAPITFDPRNPVQSK
jgi:hypothetical protein